jgi:type I restriction enzyme S subunit
VRNITGELPFEIPDSWEWVRLENICSTITDGDHQPPPQVLHGVPFLVISNVSQGFFDWSNTRFVSEEYYDGILPQRKAETGDILLTVTGSYGIPLLVENIRKFCFQRHIALLKPLIENVDYLMILLQSPCVKQQFDDAATGTAQKTVSLNSLRNLIVPIPPLGEQIRIVERIGELLPLVGDYDGAEQQLSTLNASFPDALKKSILQAAVQGKLVVQDPNEEPASLLLEHIRAQKDALVKSGKIKRDKHESVIFRRDNSHYEIRNSEEVCIDDELPFEIPESWIWARLGSLGVFVRGGGIKRSETRTAGVPCIRYGEIYTTYNIAITSTVSFVDGVLADKSKPVSYGDLLFTLTGENKEEIGKTIAYMGSNRTVIGGDLAIFTSHHQNPMFLSYLMNSPCAIQQKALLGTGDIIVHISCDKLASVLVPIPPLGEQDRIVAQLEELLPLLSDCVTNPA